MLLKYFTIFSGLNFLLLASVLLLKRMPYRKDNTFLGIVFILMAVFTLILSFYNTALVQNNYYFLSKYIPIDSFLVALLGPFFYFYIKSLLNKPLVKSIYKLFLHLLPVLPSIIFFFYCFSLAPNERSQLYLDNFNKGVWQFNILNSIFYLQMTAYLIISFIIVSRQLKVSSKVVKGNVLVDIAWLRNLMIIDIAIMALTAPICFFLANERAAGIIAQLAMDIQLVYIFVKTIWQTGVFPVEVIEEQPLQGELMIEEDSLTNQKGTILKISLHKVDDYYKMLIEYMDEYKPYLKENCSIQDISEGTCISVHHLSNLINTRIAKNFSDFINEYRIEYAKKMLSCQKYKKMTIEFIGYECGFGSKSSFNKAFKKHTNLTPSEFRNIKNEEYA